MALDVKEKLLNIFISRGQMNHEESLSTIQQMRRTGRLMEEYFGWQDWYFVLKIVLTLCENFFFHITTTIYFNSLRSEQFFETKYLLLEVEVCKLKCQMQQILGWRNLKEQVRKTLNCCHIERFIYLCIYSFIYSFTYYVHI